MNGKELRPEEELLSSFFFNDVQLVVVPQSTGHLLIRHIVSVLSYDIIQEVLLPSSPRVLVCRCEVSFSHHATHLVVSPEMSQSIWIHHSEHKVVLVFPSDVFLVTIITQQLVDVVPQQSAIWSQKGQKSR